MAISRWYRLDADWNETPWLAALPYAARSVWPYLIGYVKLNGVGGVCKAQSVRRFSEKTDIPPRHVAEFLEAATAHGSLVEQDGYWCIPQWDEFQPDPTNKKRQQEFRMTKSTQIEPSVTDRNSYVTEVERYVTESNGQTMTMTPTKTETTPQKAEASGTKPAPSSGHFSTRDSIYPLLPASHQTPELDAALREWEEYRKQRKIKPWVEKTVLSRVNLIASVPTSETIRAINEAISLGWQGFFIKTEPSTSQKSSPSKPAPKECPEW